MNQVQGWLILGDTQHFSRVWTLLGIKTVLKSKDILTEQEILLESKDTSKKWGWVAYTLWEGGDIFVNWGHLLQTEDTEKAGTFVKKGRYFGKSHFWKWRRTVECEDNFEKRQNFEVDNFFKSEKILRKDIFGRRWQDYLHSIWQSNTIIIIIWSNIFMSTSIPL